MRTDQYIGLSPSTQKFVAKMEAKQYDTFEGAFCNKFPLFSYDEKYFEYVQEEPWSSGPMFFIALKDAEGTPVSESLWTQEEIDAYF